MKHYYFVYYEGNAGAKRKYKPVHKCVIHQTRLTVATAAEVLQQLRNYLHGLNP